MMLPRNFFVGKKVCIIGLGKTGFSTARLLSRLGAKIFISEILLRRHFLEKISSLPKDIEYEFGKHSTRLFEADLVIKSPGVVSYLSVIRQLKKKGIPIWSDVELVYRLTNPSKIIAITGTNGKTTTVTLLGEIFRHAGLPVIVAGNIGFCIADAIDKIDRKSILVLEVSSYQLEDTYLFQPDISCILNISPDHFEHHKTMKNYIRSKAQIFKNQQRKNFCLLNYDDPITHSLAKICPAKVIFFSKEKTLKSGIWVENGKISGKIASKSFILPLQTNLPGKHNLDNILVSIAASIILGVNISTIMKTISLFTGLPHRLEFVRRIKGVEYINDSKSTNIFSTKVALEAYNRPIHLIMGGRDKGASYSIIKPLIKQRAKSLLLIGEAAKKIASDIGDVTQTFFCKSLQEAVLEAHSRAKANEIVLFSPGCSSFDQFRNFEHRGEVYKEIVNKMI